MDKIKSAMASIGNALPGINEDPEVEGADEGETTEETGSTVRDKWSQGVEAGREGWDAVRGQLEEVGGFSERVEDMVNESVGGVLEFIEPTVDDLRALGSTAKAVSGAVSEAVEGFSSRVNELALDYAVHGGGDLSARVEERLQAVGQGLSEGHERLQQLNDQMQTELEDVDRYLSRLGVEVTADMSSQIQACLNAVGGAAADAVVDQRERFQAGAQALRGVDEKMGQMDAVWKAIDEVFPMRGSEVATRFAVRAWADALEMTPEVADYMAQTGLVTREGFDDWLGEVGPGETRQLDLGLAGEFVKTVGGSAEISRSVSVSRSEDNPHELILTVKGERGSSVDMGTSIQGKGASAGVGMEGAREVQFRFDERSEEDRQTLASAVLSSQLQMPSSRLLAALDDHFLSVTHGQGVNVGGQLEKVLVSARAEHGVGGRHQQFLREGELIDRHEVEFSSTLDAGLGHVRFPSAVVEELEAVNDDEVLRTLVMHLSGASQGQVGLDGDVEARVSVGAESNQEGDLERLVATMKVDGAAMGHRGFVEMDMVIHQPQVVAQALGRGVGDLYDDLAAGELRVDDLRQSMEAAGLAAEELLGLQVSATSVEEDGFNLSAFGLEAGDITERHRTREIWSFGRPLADGAATEDAQWREEVSDRRSAQVLPC